MNKLFGELLTAYALYILSGAGLLFIFFAGSCWYVQGNFGWIALGVYLVAWWIIAECLMRAIANWIIRNSRFHGNKPLERVPYVREEKVRPPRHGY
jgi:hypothetical protein